MDLGKINRDAEDRSVVWAAGVTALMGLSALLSASAAFLNGNVLGGRVGVLVAIVFFALAVGVYRGSRAAAVAVVSLFILQAAINFLVYGLMGMGPVWTVILGAVLWAGMRGVFAQAARPASAPPSSRRPA
jgi:hypothetical protein